MKEIFPAATAEKLNANNLKLIESISEHCAFISEHAELMRLARKEANAMVNERDRAIAYHDKVAPLMESIRYEVDHLELVVDDELWPLPKYREMLFIR